VPRGIAGSPCLRVLQIRSSGLPGWELGVGLTAVARINHVKKSKEEIADDDDVLNRTSILLFTFGLRSGLD
jgi:hypothetical protein